MGAGVATYGIGVDIEEMEMKGIGYCGGTIDIAKFFDRVPRQLCYQLAKAAGIPGPIIDTYWKFHQGLKVRNSINGNLGSPYSQQASIPQ